MPEKIIERAERVLDNPIEKVKEISSISHEDFNTQYIKKNEPVLITEMMSNWKAKELWSLDYFEKIGANKETYSYQGNIRQNDTNWQFGEFKDYLDEIRNYDESKTQTYLGNMPIAKMFPELLEHVDFSLLSKNVVRNSTSLWIGPPGTITGFHTDRLANNILALIEGRKLVFMVSPKENMYMHTSNKYEPGSKLSDVNLEDFKIDKTPLFKKAHVRFAVIHPGQMLFIPQNWWHCVYGLDTSISSNNFAFTAWDNFKMKSAELTKRTLHNLRLFGTEDCVCHYYDDNGKRHKR